MYKLDYKANCEFQLYFSINYVKIYNFFVSFYTNNTAPNTPADD